MKRLFILVVAFLLIGGNLFSQDLRPIGRDLSAFMEGLGKEAVPYLQQNALWGDGLGIAQISHESKFYIAFGAGATLSSGITKFIDEENSAFELLNVYNLIQTMVKEAKVDKYYNQIQTMMPYPALRISAGFVPIRDLEVSVILSILPQGITDLLVGSLIPNMEGLTFNRMNVGVRVRKPLLEDSGWFPAISLGTGYTYSRFNASYPLPADQFEQDIKGSPLSVEGSLGLHTALHSFGLDLTLSKKLAVFVPYLTFSSWYQRVAYNAEVTGFEATLDKPPVNSDDGEDIYYTDQAEGVPGAEVNLSDLAFIIEGGLEIKLSKFSILTAATYSLGSGSFGLSAGMRLAFGKGN